MSRGAWRGAKMLGGALLLAAAGLLCRSVPARAAEGGGGGEGEGGAATATARPAPGVTLAELLRLRSRGLSEELLLEHVRRRGLAFALSAPNVLELKQAGLSDRLVRALIDLEEQHPPATRPPASPPPPPASPRASPPASPPAVPRTPSPAPSPTLTPVPLPGVRPEAKLALEEGDARFNAREYAAAAAAYRKAIAADALAARAHQMLAMIALQEKRPAEAYPEARRAVELVPRYAEFHWTLAWVHSLQGRREAARQELVTARRLAPREAKIAQDLGSVLLELARYPEAAEAFEAALALEPGRLAARLGLGQAETRAGKPGQAVTVLAGALARPELAQAEKKVRLALRLALGEAYLALKQPEQARAEFARAEQEEPDSLPVLFALAQAQDAAGRLAEAAGTYRKILRREPRQPTALVNLGTMLLRLAQSRPGGGSAGGEVEFDPQLLREARDCYAAYLQAVPDGEHSAALRENVRQIDAALGATGAPAAPGTPAATGTPGGGTPLPLGRGTGRK